MGKGEPKSRRCTARQASPGAFPSPITSGRCAVRRLLNPTHIVLLHRQPALLQQSLGHSAQPSFWRSLGNASFAAGPRTMESGIPQDASSTTGGRKPPLQNPCNRVPDVPGSSPFLSIEPTVLLMPESRLKRTPKRMSAMQPSPCDVPWLRRAGKMNDRVIDDLRLLQRGWPLRVVSSWQLHKPASGIRIEHCLIMGNEIIPMRSREASPCPRGIAPTAFVQIEEDHPGIEVRGIGVEPRMLFQECLIEGPFHSAPKNGGHGPALKYHVILQREHIQQNGEIRIQVERTR